jgi:hypothetical protein
VAEWSKALVSKTSMGKPIESSNLSLSARDFPSEPRGLHRSYNWSKIKGYKGPLINHTYKFMIRGNFIGAAIVAVLYTVYIMQHPLPEKWQTVLALVVLNALTIVLMAFAFKN